MALAKDRIEQLAPDQASLSAAIKLIKPANWPVLARNSDGSLLWGECQGSGATPYRVVVSPGDVGYKCTCPSRKFPCKHSLAVMLMASEAPARFAEGATPDWVNDWLSRRRPKAPGTASAGVAATAAPAATGEADARTAPSLDAALDAALAETAAAAGKAADPKAAARAEAQRQRLADNREAAVREGLDDLERWIGDELNAGLAGFAQRALGSTRTIATRLVDSKAQGLAQRVEALATEVVRLPEQKRGDRAIERLGALQLIASAYRRQDRLPAALKADVRRTVGWTVRREDLLADPAAPRLQSTWIVAATLSEVQPDKLRRLETWLLNAAAGEGCRRFAQLVEFVPVSAGASGLPFAAGEVLAGEVVYYPSTAPLRGLLATRTAAGEPTAWPEFAAGLDAALAGYETALAALPWLDAWPLAARKLHIAQLASGQLGLSDTAGRVLPIDRRQSETALPLLGLDDVSAAFTWDGSAALLLAAETPVGRWYEA